MIRRTLALLSLCIAACIAATLIFPAMSQAGTEEIAAQLDQLFRADYDYPVENRRRILSLIVQYWEELDRKIPRVTPDEHNWFDDELRSGNEERIVNANNTKIGGLESLRMDISRCLDMLKPFRNGAFIDANFTRLPTHSAEAESLSWLIITESCFIHNEFIRVHLAHSGLTEATMTTRQADEWLSYLLGLVQSLISQDIRTNIQKP